MLDVVKFLVFGVVAAVLAGLIYLSVIGKENRHLPHGSLFSPNNKQVTDLGSKIYAEHCASCHGRNLEGQVEDWQTHRADGTLPAPPHDETGHTWHHNDQLLFDITKFGTSKAISLKDYKSTMPAYEGVLDDEEIIAVLSFIKSTWPEDFKKGHDRLNADTHN